MRIVGENFSNLRRVIDTRIHDPSPADPFAWSLLNPESPVEFDVYSISAEGRDRRNDKQRRRGCVTNRTINSFKRNPRCATHTALRAVLYSLLKVNDANANAVDGLSFSGVQLVASVHFSLPE